MTRARLMVVDDEPGMREGAELVLKRDYDVLALATPAEAIEQVLSFRPDLAILDVRMPGMDGFELMGRLKEIRPDLDVILMTGSVAESDRKLVRALKGEAFYFLLKPFDRDVLLALVERCLALRRLEEAERRHARRLEAELAGARAFQQSLMPPASGEIGAYRVHALYRPAEELGGDLYDYAACGDGLACLVADVSSHGASAAMVTGMVKSAFHSCAEDGYDPVLVTTRVNVALSSFPTDHFVTLFAARLRGGELDYVNAGHPPGLVLPGGTALDATTPLLHRTLELAEPVRGSVPFPPGHRLLLYTDGVTEAKGDDGRFGEERLHAVATAHRAGDGLLEAVAGALEEFVAGRPLADDLTMLVAEAG